MAPKVSRSAKGKNKIGESSEDPQEHQPTVKSRRLTFNIRSRKLLQAKYGKLPDFPNHSFTFPARLANAGVANFVLDHGDYYPDLVRDFYHNLRIVTDEFDDFTLLSKVSNKDICLDVEEFGRVLGIPSQGLVLLQGNIPEDWQPYSKMDVFVDMCRPTQRDTVRQQLATKFNMFGSSLSVSDRMLHLIIAYVLFPKNSNHSRVNEFELMVLLALRRGIEVNWALSIMRHMQLMASLKGGLPYARAISHIVRNAGVLLQREPKKNMDEQECAITTATALKNTGIVTDREGRFVYKVDFEPTVPQVPQPPEGGYTMDMMFAKLCSIQTSIDNNKRENNYEHNLMRRQMREIQRTQRRILAHYEGEEGSEEEDEQEDDDEEHMDESD